MQSRFKTAAEVKTLLKAMQGDLNDTQFAAQLGITSAYLSEIHKGRKGIGPKVCIALNLIPETIFREVA